ncbi:MAG: ComEC/Rec2 family competence protein [Acidobacteriota bacterium]
MRLREPLLLPLIAIASGILLAQTVDFSLRDAAVPALAFAACSLLPITRWLRTATLMLALLFAGAFLIPWHQPKSLPVIDSELREVVLLEGCVVVPTLFSDDRAQFTLELAPGARTRVSAPSRAVADAVGGDSATSNEGLELAYGQRVEIEARIRAPHNYNNPGAFDYASYLAHRNVYWTALVPSGGEIRVLPGQCGSRFMEAIFRLRVAALRRINQLYPGNNYTSAMLEGVLIGESRHLERVWTEDFRRSGTFHALVISGLHITVLASVLLFLLRFVPISIGKALILTSSAAWLYAMVSGFSVPVLRAAAGFTMFTLARMLFRRARPLNLLAAVAIGFLTWDPSQLFDASFQLSFLSVVAITALAAPIIEATSGRIALAFRSISNVEVDPHLEPRLASLRVELRLFAETVNLWTRVPLSWILHIVSGIGRGLLFFWDSAIISAAVQVGLAVPMAVYFHRLSFTGITANLLVVPLMNAVVPAGFLAVFTQWHWAAWLTERLLLWSAKIAAWHANLEPAWRVPNPPVWLSIGFSAALVLVAILMRRGSRQVTAPSGRGSVTTADPEVPILSRDHRERLSLESDNNPVEINPKPAKRNIWATTLQYVAVLAVFALLGLLIRSPWRPQIDPGTLELTTIDVGQGDSLLVVFPQGKIMVIDGGGRLEYGRNAQSNNHSKLDIGEDVVSTYLWSRGIRHIDILAATHAHQDHIGGLASIMTNFHPDEFWTGANPPAALIAQARSQGVRVNEQRASAPFDLGGAHIEILAPTPDYATFPGQAANNNDSLVMRIAYGSRSFLLTGDMEGPIEYQLLALGPALHSDVLKVGHHGSKTSTSQEFLDAVAPSVAMISAGYDNSFGHPHPTVMARLEARGAAILRTDQDGLATVKTDGHRLFFSLNAWSEHQKPLAYPEHLTN